MADDWACLNGNNSVVGRGTELVLYGVRSTDGENDGLMGEVMRSDEGDVEEGREIEIFENRILMFVVCSEVRLATKVLVL
jgi:hypothetical protein